jgi:hypothetical protein
MARSRRACPERSRGNPGDAYWQMFFEAFQPQTTNQINKVTSSERSRGICVALDEHPTSMEAPPSPLSSRPERTQISSHAALDKSACAPFCKGKAHEVHQRHQALQEIRGSVVEGSAVQRTRLGNVFRHASDLLPAVRENTQSLQQIVHRFIAFG